LALANPPEGRRRRGRLPGAHVAVLVAGCLAFGTYAVILGQDYGYDVKNYHYYVVYALLHHRIDFDYAPAQLQSYLNPLSFVPFYALVTHLKPVVAGFVLGMWHGAVLGLLFGLGHTLLAAQSSTWRFGAALLCAALGTYGPVFLGELGSSNNDPILTLCIVAGLWCVVAALHAPESAGWRDRKLLVGGVLLGAAAGLKLVEALYALAALGALVVAMRGGRTRFAVGGRFAVALTAGFLLTGGAWMATLWAKFRNPFFPFFNATFASPYFEKIDFADRNFLPTSLAEALTYPLRLATALHREAPNGYRDSRFALFFLLLLGMGGVALWRWLERRGKPPAETIVADAAIEDEDEDEVEDAAVVDDGAVPEESLAAAPVPGYGDPVRFVLVWFVLSYVMWQVKFSITRYALPLEATAPLLIVLVVERLFRGKRSRLVALAAVTAAIVACMRPADYGRIPWGPRYFTVEVPRYENPEKTLILMAHNRPRAYLVPFFQPEIRFLGLVSNLTKAYSTTRFQDEMRAIIRDHDGPILLMSDVRDIQDDAVVLHDTYKLVPKEAPCQQIVAPHERAPIFVCPLDKAPAEPAP